MKFKNYSKIIFTVLATVCAAIAFACGSSPATNSSAVNSPSNTVSRQTNGSTNPVPEKKPPTMTDYPVGGAQNPTEAYRMLFAAVKSQETAKIKSMYSQGSVGLAEMQASRSNQPIEKVYENGFTETTFADNFPQIRDERIKGNFGAVEVWSERSKKWEDLPFILEDGSWKLAIGDAFSGKWQSPGKGQSQIEQENANAQNPNPIQKMPTGNTSTNNVPAPKKMPMPKAQ